MDDAEIRPTRGNAEDAARTLPTSPQIIARQPYVPQFTKSTALILSRVKKGDQASAGAKTDNLALNSFPVNRDAYEATRSRLIGNLKTSDTLCMPPAAVAAPAPAPLTPGASRKRRLSFEAAIEVSPKRPSIASDEMQLSKGQGIFSKVPVDSGSLAASNYPRSQQDVEAQRKQRLGSIPSYIVPKKSELVGFSAGGYTEDEQEEYFSLMSKIDILNILSFGDQLQPGLLVKVMTSIARRHPDLPIFGQPAPARGASTMATSQAPRRPVAGPAGRAERPPMKPSQLKEMARSRIVGLEDEAVDVRGPKDVVPATWPQAGHGLYATLPPEVDVDYLVDDDDAETFSYFPAK